MCKMYKPCFKIYIPVTQFFLQENCQIIDIHHFPYIVYCVYDSLLHLFLIEGQ
jgi:hypothetical protein